MGAVQPDVAPPNPIDPALLAAPYQGKVDGPVLVVDGPVRRAGISKVKGESHEH